MSVPKFITSDLSQNSLEIMNSEKRNRYGTQHTKWRSNEINAAVALVRIALAIFRIKHAKNSKIVDAQMLMGFCEIVEIVRGTSPFCYAVCVINC
jgi:hypothetical protein